MPKTSPKTQIYQLIKSSNQGLTAPEIVEASKLDERKVKKLLKDLTFEFLVEAKNNRFFLKVPSNLRVYTVADIAESPVARSVSSKFIPKSLLSRRAE